MHGGGTRGREALGWAELRVVGAPGVLLGPFYRRLRRWRAGRVGGGPAGFVAGFNGGGGELLCRSASGALARAARSARGDATAQASGAGGTPPAQLESESAAAATAPV